MRHGALLREESGQDTVEFALVGAWISVVAILVLQAVGPQLLEIYLTVRWALMGITSGGF